MFDGSDPHGWIFRIEEFFDFRNTPSRKRERGTLCVRVYLFVRERENEEEVRGEEAECVCARMLCVR